ncbi:MAG: NAD(P)/FAD-dependent oxidoreductase [Microbacterium sp.]|jgi:thioredoxin reductase|uniref:NAD(P)/FAD-dependent oxidoreductase n=1 Tax=Microbacterium sp. TaxID=51671 RepID=UPI002837FDFA|nr:NAD(P)/FAD-dependent oxidoreductase [Microbacterium sp.]MDR2323090.1 NAD(P)/FAD-dependent oxidoreductase [Microbacterium sp.]
MNTAYDAIIVGAGPAGLSAAHLLGRARRSVLVIDGGEPRNRFASAMHGVLGIDNLPPAELRARGRAELEPYDVTFLDGQVDRVTASDDAVTAHLTHRTFTARALIAATGVTDGLPDIPGLAEHWGTRVLHCPYCHGWEVRGQRLAVIATSTMSPFQAQLVRQWSDRITAFTAAAEPLDAETAQRLSARGTAIVSSPVTSVTVSDDDELLLRTADGATTAADAIFLGTALHPRDGFLPGDLVRVDTEHGPLLRTDPSGRTSHPRIWAAGNITNLAANVPMSMGAGSAVGGAVNASLMFEDTQRAIADQR